MLYPYRASAHEEPGALAVRRARAARVRRGDGSERSDDAAPSASSTPARRRALDVRIRCLQVQHRAVEAPCDRTVAIRRRRPSSTSTARATCRGTRRSSTSSTSPPLPLLPLADVARAPFAAHLAGPTTSRGAARRRRAASSVGVRPAARAGRRGRAGRAPTGPTRRALVKVVVDGRERHRLVRAPTRPRDDAMRHSLVAVHTLLAVDDGAFVSLLDPPTTPRGAVGGCTSDGHVPGAHRRRRHASMLSSPIILYDHPAVAPESPGDLCDATEIDEILALRVLTLTDEEKAEAAATDPRAAAIIDRMRRHAARAVGAAARHDAASSARRRARRAGASEPAAAVVGPARRRRGRPVDRHRGRRRRRGRARARACGSARRAGPTPTTCSSPGWWPPSPASSTTSTATMHVAVTLDDDPPPRRCSLQGRYLYFHPDEIEPLDAVVGGAAS